MLIILPGISHGLAGSMALVIYPPDGRVRMDIHGLTEGGMRGRDVLFVSGTTARAGYIRYRKRKPEGRKRRRKSRRRRRRRRRRKRRRNRRDGE